MEADKPGMQFGITMRSLESQLELEAIRRKTWRVQIAVGCNTSVQVGLLWWRWREGVSKRRCAVELRCGGWKESGRDHGVAALRR